MKYVITIDSGKTIDRAFFEVYLDMKKKIFLDNKPLPTSLEKVNCECETDTKYSVRESCK